MKDALGGAAGPVSLSFSDPGAVDKLWGGQFCPQPAFSRLWPPKRRP